MVARPDANRPALRGAALRLYGGSGTFYSGGYHAGRNSARAHTLKKAVPAKTIRENRRLEPVIARVQS
jgi:hypothetical protein